MEHEYIPNTVYDPEFRALIQRCAAISNEIKIVDGTVIVTKEVFDAFNEVWAEIAARRPDYNDIIAINMAYHGIKQP